MDRREAVKYISILMGGAVVGGQAFLLGCKSETGNELDFSADEIAYLNEIAETILPATKTPGAKAAKVGEFMTVMVRDCYEKADQEVFLEGMKKLNKAAEEKYDKSFMNLSAAARTELLIQQDKEAKDFQKELGAFNEKENEKLAKDPAYVKQKKSPHYFTMMKQLTLLGYFTSKEGATQALRYEPVPGRYEGCIPYKKGDRAFA